MFGSLILTFLPVSVIALLATDAAPSPSWLQYIQSGGVIGMFVVLMYALLTRKLVMGWTYDRMEAERDLYRNIAFRTNDLAERQVNTAEEMLKRMNSISLRGDVLEARETKRRLEDLERERDDRT